MPARARPPLRRTPWERAIAWLYTGPPGRLWGGVADFATVFARLLAARLRSRLLSGPRAPRR